MVCLPRKAWRYHFIEQPLPEDWGSLLCQETSTLAIVLEIWVDRSRETLWKCERIHRSRASEAYFSHPAPSQISCTLPSTFCIGMPFWGHTVRFWRIGKERLGDQSLTKSRGKWDGRSCWLALPSAQWEPLSPQPTGSTRLRACLGLLSHQHWESITAGKFLQRQLVRTLSASGYEAFEQTTPLSSEHH